MMIFDAVSPAERVRLTMELVAKTDELNRETLGVRDRVAAASAAMELIAKLGETVTVEPEESELSDDPNSPNYRFRDTGYIPDSRKELAANSIKQAKAEGRQVTAKDIDWKAIEENPRAADQIITKSNLFGSVDWAALKDGGMEPGAGFLIDRIYASIAPKPDEATPQKRADYAGALDTIRTRLESLKTVDEVRAVLVEIKDELEGFQLDATQSVEYEELSKALSALGEKAGALKAQRDALADAANAISRKISALEYEQNKRKRRKWKPDPEIDKAIAELEPQRQKALEAVTRWEQENPDAIERWETVRDENGIESRIVGGFRSQMDELRQKMRAIKQAAHANNMVANPVTRGWLTFGERFLAVVKYRYTSGSKAFRDHVFTAQTGKIKDWGWAEKEGSTIETGAKKNTKREAKFHLQVVENIERIGGRAVKVDSTLALEKFAGLRAIQSGNWVLDDPAAAKFHVQGAATSFADLSDILGISQEAIGLGGRLALAFGARGTGNAGGQTAMATYESTNRVINLTKMAGGGSLGHEWGHALDDMLAELMTGEPNPTRNNFGSDNPSVLPAGAIQDAMRELRQVWFTGNEPSYEIFKCSAAQVRTAKHNVEGYPTRETSKIVKNAGNAAMAVSRITDYLKGRGYKDDSKQLKQWRTLAAAYYLGETKGTALRTGPKVSSFLLEAIKLDEGVRNKYWSRTHEMFARCFQSFLEDSLADMSRKNDYLSAMADNKFYIDPFTGAEPKPFPEGDERKACNAAMRKLMNAIRDERVFEKAMGNQALMDAIFGEPVYD